MATHPIVSVARLSSYDDAALVRAGLIAALAPLGGMGAFVPAGKRVLLKPNFVKAMDPARGGLTHPSLIVVVARLALEAGAAEVMVGDSPAFGSARGIADAMGLTPRLAALGARVVELKTSRVIKHGLLNNTFDSLTFAAEALDADVLINLPKAKSHCQMVMSGAVKNLYGCVPGRIKAVRHCMVKDSRYDFGRMLVDNARILNADLTIMDGIVAMQGQGPTSGEPYAWGWILAGVDPVAIDAIVADAMGYEADQIPALKAAFHMHYGEVNVGKIDLRGAALADLGMAGFKPARLMPITFNPVKLFTSYLRHRWLQLTGALRR